jgi:hypothetical protein
MTDEKMNRRQCFWTPHFDTSDGDFLSNISASLVANARNCALAPREPTIKASPA